MTTLRADIYAATAPVGARLVGLTDQDYQLGTSARVELNGTGSIRIVIHSAHAAATAANFAKGNYCVVPDLDISPSLTLATSLAADDKIDTASAHGLAVRDRVEFTALTGGAGLSLNTPYWVVAVPSSTEIQVSATKGGAVLDFTTDITAGTMRALKDVAGGFLQEGDFTAVAVREEVARDLSFTGPGPLSYLGNAHMLHEPYVASGSGVYNGPRDDGRWHWGTASKYGSILKRIIDEALDPDRTINPILGVTYSFNDTQDSALAAWTGSTNDFTLDVGENYMSCITKFIRVGLTIRMTPGLHLEAYQGTYGTDRSSAIFAAGKVRWEIGTNISGDRELRHPIRGAARVKYELVRGSSSKPADMRAVTDAGATLLREAFLSVPNTNDPATLIDAGTRDLALRAAETDIALFSHIPGDAELSGEYTPGKHYVVGDTARLHTGTAAYDFNEQNLRVAAINWIFRSGGDWDIIPELGASYYTPGAPGTISGTTLPPTSMPCTCPNPPSGAYGTPADFPVVVSDEDGSGFSIDSIVPLPASIAAGDLLLAVVSWDASAALTSFPAGWTELLKGCNYGCNEYWAIAYRIADGTEGATITVIHSGQDNWKSNVMRITGHGGAAAPPELVSTNGATNAPNPPSLTPTGGSQKILWVVAMVDGDAPTARPAGYTMVQTYASGVGQEVGWKQLEAASEDPGSWTLSAVRAWGAATISVRPGSGAFTGDPPPPAATDASGSLGTEIGCYALCDHRHGVQTAGVTPITDTGAFFDDPYVEGALQELAARAWKQPVRAATTVAGTLASSFENGDTIDGVVLATGDRILIKDQTAGAENGIYIVNPSGAPVRTTDFDAGAEAVGAAIMVTEGTTNADKVFICTTNAPITMGTTALAFAALSAAAALIVQEDDVDVDTAVSTIDFRTALSVTSSPAGEANVSVDLGTGASQAAAGDHGHTVTNPGNLNLILGNGVDVISTGVKMYVRWPFAGTILRATLLADVSGSIVVDIWKDSYANFPPTVADTITASAKPTLSSQQKSEDSTLTGWTTGFAEGDIYAVNVDSASTVKRVTLELKYQRS